MHDSGQAIRFALTCFYSAIYLESFFYYNGVATAEGPGFWTPEANWTQFRSSSFYIFDFPRIGLPKSEFG